MLHEKLANATLEFAADRHLMNSFVLITNEGDKEEETLLRSVLLLFWCVVRE